MSFDDDNRPTLGPGWRYAGWIIGGLFAVVVIAATFAFIGHDTKTASKTAADRAAAKAPATTLPPKTSTTGAGTTSPAPEPP